MNRSGSIWNCNSTPAVVDSSTHCQLGSGASGAVETPCFSLPDEASENSWGPEVR